MMIWDPDKAKELLKSRNIILAEIAGIILDERYTAILSHPKKPSQRIFVVSYKGYMHAVPFVIDAEENIIIKTAYPSRKREKRFRRPT